MLVAAFRIHKNFLAAAMVWQATDTKEVIPITKVSTRNGCRIPPTYTNVWTNRENKNI